MFRKQRGAVRVIGGDGQERSGAGYGFFDGVEEWVGVGGEDREGFKQVTIRVICVAGGVIGSAPIAAPTRMRIITAGVSHARIRGI